MMRGEMVIEIVELDAVELLAKKVPRGEIQGCFLARLKIIIGMIRARVLKPQVYGYGGRQKV